jgi:hypothetical protein
MHCKWAYASHQYAPSTSTSTYLFIGNSVISLELRELAENLGPAVGLYNDCNVGPLIHMEWFPQEPLQAPNMHVQ